MPNISIKGSNLPTSPIRKLSSYANQAKAKGIQVLHLNIGQPDIPTPENALEAVKNFDQSVLAYGPSEGTPEYRMKMARYYNNHNIRVSPDDILVTTGASEAIIMTLDCITNEGDEIIIPEPFYANYDTFAAACGVKVVPVTSQFDTNFALPPIEEIRTKISNKTRAIFICNPNNPTGYVYTKKELESLAELVKEFDIFLIADEVYREFVYDNEKHISILELEGLDEYTILVDSMSKRYSMCGARIGCLVSKNKEVLEAALKFAQSRLSPPTLALVASEAALDTHESYLKNAVAEYLLRRNTLVKLLNEIKGVSVSLPKGAFYCLVKLPVEDVEHFSQWLLTSFEYQDKTLMLAPAGGFYGNKEMGKHLVRIAYVLNTSDLTTSVLVLKKALEKYLKENSAQ